jgi:hypothetical protein
MWYITLKNEREKPYGYLIRSRKKKPQNQNLTYFQDKNSQQVRCRRIVPQNNEYCTWQGFSSKIRNKTKTTIPIISSTSCHSKYSRERNKWYPEFKGRHKLVANCRWCNLTRRNLWWCHKSFLELTNEYTRLAGHKTNIWKSIFLYINKKPSEKEIKILITFIILKKNQIKCNTFFLFELRSLHFQDRCSTIWTPAPIHFTLDRVSHFCAG